MGKYILIADVQRLRRKILDSEGDLRILWGHLKKVALMDDSEHGAYPVFAHLVTNDERYCKKAKAYLIDKVLGPPADWDSPAFLNEHMWIHTALSVKYCIYYDWLMNAGLLSDDESKAIADKITSLAYNYMYHWAKCVIAVPRTFLLPNNQTASVACGFLYIGYLFSQKYGNDRRAKKLFQMALDVYPGLIGQVSAGGYNGEGAPYAFDIACSSLVLYTALLEEITGEPLFFKKFPTNNVSLKELIDVGLNLLSVSGLLIPIDSYGYSSGPNNLTPVVYAANKTKNPAYLNLLYKYNFWHSDTMTWQKDDRIFTLLFWPENLKRNHSPAAKKSWFLPSTFGGLVDEKNKIELFQTYHDIQAGHDHVDPNSIVLEAYNSPLILDGYPDPRKEFFFGKTDVSVIDGRKMHSSGVESICSHNTITVDRDDFYRSRRDRNGQMVFFAESPLVDSLSSDVAEIFQPDFDLKKFERQSIFVKPGYFLIYDQLEAETSHSYTYRMYLREKAEKTGNGIVVDTYEKVRMYLLMPGRERLSVQHLDNYALTTIEGKATCVSCEKKGREAEFLTFLRIEPLREEVEDITHQWRFCSDPEDSGLKSGWYEKDYPDQEWREVSIDRPWFFYGLGHIGEKGWYRREIKIPDRYAHRKVYLMPPKAGQTTAGWGGVEQPFQVWVNGQEVPSGIKVGCHHRFLDITEYLKQDVENLIAFSIQSSTHSAFFGQCVLYAELEPQESPEFARVSKRVASVEINGIKDRVIFNNSEGKTVSLNGWQTDACVGFMRNFVCYGLLAVSKVQDTKGCFRCKSLERINFCRDGQDFNFSNCKYGNKIMYQDKELSFELEYGNYIQIESDSNSGSYRFSLNADRHLSVYLNGSQVVAEYDDSAKTVSFDLREPQTETGFTQLLIDLEEKDPVRKIEAIIKIGDGKVKEAETGLLGFLSHPDFAVRAAAVEALGKLRSVRAAKALRKCLVDRNWQVQKEAVIALGKIRDRRAVKPMLQLLKKDRYYLPLALIWALSHFDSPVVDKVLKDQVNIYGSPIDRRAASRGIDDCGLKKK